MDKEQLIAWIQSMPDNLMVMPIEMSKQSQESNEWQSQHRTGSFGGVYRSTVNNELTIKLQFKTTFEGEFRRTYEDPAGMFRNIRRIDHVSSKA